MSELVDWARQASEKHLAEALPLRWRHVQAVAEKAGPLAALLPDGDGDLLVAAAWLHDIGYAPGVADTGLHALDGGRWLRRSGQPDRLAALVAYHSCAIFEAEERGLADVLTTEFVAERSATADALWYADMTTGPDGQAVEVEDRLAEIELRYGPDHLVTRFWVKARPTLLDAIRRVEILRHPM